MKATLSPRKRPRQDRSQATVEAIFQAAAHIFGEFGFEAATTNAIAERAGVSVGSLYQYFPNKRVLLNALHERRFEANMLKLAQACDRGHERSLPEAVRHISDVCTENHVSSQALSKVFHAELPPIWPDRQGRACVIHLRERLRAFLEAHRASISVDIERALFFTMAFGGSLVKAGLADRPQDLGNGVIAREMAETILLFLTGTREGISAEKQGVA